MKYSTRALISVLWLCIYNLLANYAPVPQKPFTLHYAAICIIYAPMLMALLVWIERPKVFYKRLKG